MKIILLIVSGFIATCTIAQNVGIGTTTPNARLEIRHTSSLSSPTLLLYDNNPSNYVRLQLQNASGNKFWHIAGFIDDATDANSRLNFFHSVNGDVMSLTGDGKVGIGSFNPSEKLTVFTGDTYGFSHTNGTVKLSSYINGSNAYFGTVSNHPMNFFTNDAIVSMTLATNGNVGVNTTTPQFKLDVKGRMKIQTGTLGNIFTTPGIWFDDYRDGSNRIFFGMQDSIRLGIWGEGSPGAGWAFNFNARNGEVTVNDYKYTTPRTDFISISGADFRAVNSINQTIALLGLPGIYMINGTDGVVAPVHFPQAAVITSMLVYLYDNSGTENMIVNLFSGDHVGIAGGIANVSSSGIPGNTLLIDNTITTPDVNNGANYYYILANSSTGTWTNSNLRLTRIQINYTVAGPH
jgi:hypothetical protein